MVRRQLRQECPVPSKPRQAEQDEHHAKGHAAYRSWCEHCVRGRGRVSPHVSVPEGDLPEVGVDYVYMGPEGSQETILVCLCKRTGCLAATRVPEKGMNAYAFAFFAGWLRGLGWKRLLLRSDNERALLALLRVQPRVWKVSKWSSKRALGGTTQRMDSQRLVCEKSKRGTKTHETAGLGWSTGDLVSSTLSELLVEIQNSSCQVWRESSIPTGRGTTRRTRGRRCGENDGWHFRWSSGAHPRIIVPLRTWIVERHESSAHLHLWCLIPNFSVSILSLSPRTSDNMLHETGEASLTGIRTHLSATSLEGQSGYLADPILLTLVWGEAKCFGPNAKEADLWVNIWEGPFWRHYV